MSENASKAYIATFTGKKFFLLNPRIEDIDVVDIAHSLAMQCRWTGHTKFHYSVAQHAYYCSLLGPENEAFHRLNHDDPEAYIADMNRPLKHYTAAGDAYRKVEQLLQDAIYDAFGLSRIEPASVKLADEAMLYTELEQLVVPLDWEPSNLFNRSKAAPIIIERWTPEEAEKKFLERFHELYKRRIN